jgi:hypothetical protein
MATLAILFCRKQLRAARPPVNTNSLPMIAGSWQYSEDKYGVIIRMSTNQFPALDTFMYAAFGNKPRIPVTENMEGGRMGMYRLSPKGGGLQFGCDAKSTQVIIVRPLTGSEFMDGWMRAMKELEKSPDGSF